MATVMDGNEGWNILDNVDLACSNLEVRSKVAS